MSILDHLTDDMVIAAAQAVGKVLDHVELSAGEIDNLRAFWSAVLRAEIKTTFDRFGLDRQRAAHANYDPSLFPPLRDTGDGAHHGGVKP